MDQHFSPAVISRQTISAEQFARTHLRRFKQEQLTFAQALPTIQQAFGLGNLSDNELADLRQAYDKGLPASDLLNIVSARTGISWSAGGHTKTPVPTSAIGVGAETFAGSYDNTDIFKKTLSAMTPADPVDRNSPCPAGISP